MKLAALIGLVLGSLGLGYVGVAAAVGVFAGALGGLAALIVTGPGRGKTIPFGPYMALGGAVAAFAGHQLSQAYLRLLG